MDEARRFIRYLYPGLMFVLEVLLFFYISIPVDFKNQLAASLTVNKESALSFALTLGISILLLGGLGFLCSIIYHVTCKIFRPSNHYPLIQDARDRGWINIINRNSGQDMTDSEFRKLNPGDAWSILGAYYHARIYRDKFREAHKRIESLNDTLHGLGTTCVATIIATIIWRYAYCIHVANPFHNKYYTIPILLLIAMLYNYIRTAQEVNSFVDGISAEFMRADFDTIGPTKIYVSRIPFLTCYRNVISI